MRAKLWCRKAFWYGFETKAFSSRQKKTWKYRNNWKKISVKANCPTITFGSWILFRKEWTWLTLRSNSNHRSLSTRSVGSRKRLSPGMISFAARTFASTKKNWLEEVKEFFPGPLIIFVIALFWRAYSAIMKCVVVDYFKVSLFKILTVSFFWFFEMFFFFF